METQWSAGFEPASQIAAYGPFALSVVKLAHVAAWTVRDGSGAVLDSGTAPNCGLARRSAVAAADWLMVTWDVSMPEAA